MRVKNRKCIRRLSFKSLWASRKRNIIAICAIALTTLMFTSLFTIMLSVNSSYETYNFRQAGGYSDGSFKDLSREQADKIAAHKGIKASGERIVCGFSSSDVFGKVAAEVSYMDKNCTKWSYATPTTGKEPQKENEIAMDTTALRLLGVEPKLGTNVTITYQAGNGTDTGIPQTDSFILVGYWEYDDLMPVHYINVSKAYVDKINEKCIAAGDEALDIDLNVMLPSKLNIREQMEKIDTDLGYDWNTRDQENSARIGVNWGLTASSVSSDIDFSLVAAILAFSLLIIFTGYLIIYNIFQISVTGDIRFYGLLKTIGTTPRQLRHIITQEALFLCIIGIPVGLLLGYGIGAVLTPIALETTSIIGTKAAISSSPLIFIGSAVFAIITVFLSCRKPGKMAAKVSPIEAMRYQGLEKRGKKVRKGYQNLTIFRLTKANMARNKKRTGITIVTLGATGILFMVVATILSCAAPKEIARKDIESDYKIELETWGGDKMNPDRDWRQVQQNNPLTKAFIDQVRDVDGVEEVKVKTFMNGKIPKLSMDGEIWDADIIGLDASYAETLEKGEIQGHVTYEELEKGDKILMSANMVYWFPELKVGDSLKMVLNMGDDQVEKTFEIGAIGDYYESLGGSSFYLPQSVLEKMNPNNLNYTLEITVNDQKKNSAYQELQALADNSEYLVTGSYEEQLQKWEKNMRLMSVLCYAFLIILGGIGIMNLVNTMMNSIYTRRRELGMIQAIGMSEKQLIRMLQLEGIIYTLGTLAVSVGIGSLVGYGAFLYAKTKHMFQISEYHFPVVPAVLLICVVAFLQVLLTYGVSANFRKLSLIDRIRYAE